MGPADLFPWLHGFPLGFLKENVCTSVLVPFLLPMLTPLIPWAVIAKTLSVNYPPTRQLENPQIWQLCTEIPTPFCFHDLHINSDPFEKSAGLEKHYLLLESWI